MGRTEIPADSCLINRELDYYLRSREIDFLEAYVERIVDGDIKPSLANKFEFEVISSIAASHILHWNNLPLDNRKTELSNRFRQVYDKFQEHIRRHR